MVTPVVIIKIKFKILEYRVKISLYMVRILSAI